MSIADLAAVIKSAKGTLSNDPQSGGILKVLSAAPGFAEKIQNGAANGHTYQILHAPGEPNFVLLDKWTDKEGSARTMYYPFVIGSKNQDASIQIQAEQTHPRPLREAPPLIEGVTAPSDPFSAVLDNLEKSLDEFLSFARA
jgi:hypothetical protein